MGRPRPYLGDDGRWYDDVQGFVSAPMIDARDAENERIAYQKLARHYEARSMFYDQIERELSSGSY